jgi:hypothetical protein
MKFLKFRDHFALQKAMMEPKLLCACVDGLEVLPIVSVAIPFALDDLQVSYRLRLKPCGEARLVVIVESEAGRRCLVAGVCRAQQTPHRISDLQAIGNAHANATSTSPELPKTPATRTLMQLLELLNTARDSVRRKKYVACRDDNGLAILTAFRGDDEEWRNKLQKLVRESYRGIDEAALQRRCERFEKKFNRWSSKGFVDGARAVTTEALLSIIENYF